MKHLCLFSGIAGFTLGFEQAGFETVAFSEIEPFPCRVLEHRFPGMPNLGDVREIDGEALRGKVDVITFGSPCQDLSVAGKRAGLGGERSELFYEAIRVIAGARPAFAIWENVPGALSSNSGRDFGAALDALADIGALDLAWRVLDAQYFGVPQRRRRVFVVADFRGERAREVLFEREGLQGHSQASGEEGKAVAALSASGVGTCGADDNQGQAGGLLAGYRESGQGFWGEGVGPLRRSEGGGEYSNLVAFSSQDDGGDATLDIDPTLRVGTGLDIPSAPAVAISENQRAELRTSEVHPQLSSGGGKPGQGYPAVAIRTGGDYGDPTISVGDKAFLAANPMSDRQMAVHNGQANMAVRRLTPRECAKLQGFPPNWCEIPGASDSAQYRAYGNAVAVPVVTWIARRLADVMREKKEEVA